MIIFSNDEIAYLDWIKANPNGFVINSHKSPKSENLVLHKATCGSISSPKIGNFTTTDYMKICSLYINELDNWAEKHNRSKYFPCQLCNPKG